MRTGDSLSLILKNKTNHVLLAAVAEKGMSSGTTVGLYLLEGDELRVVAVENKRIRDAGISIAYVSKQCCY
ncbi:hypothetical protein BaRGS_00004909 [Batillaria attramentaria]|uniref:Uncharacterized protein n=1 Tax=Batillaria attramentaria TaxID=370345 RepID=A0ABD0LW82_9CAEN